MVASAPSDFNEMVNMGVKLEEGIRKGRLVRERASANSAKKFGNNYGKKKEQEVSAVAHGRSQQWYRGNQRDASVQNIGYQPQFQQLPYKPYQQRYQQPYQQQQPQQQAHQQPNAQGRKGPQSDTCPLRS